MTAFFEVNGKPFEIDSIPKKLNCSLLAVHSVIQRKTARVNTLQCRRLDQELAVITLAFFSHLSKRKLRSKTKI